MRLSAFSACLCVLTACHRPFGDLSLDWSEGDAGVYECAPSGAPPSLDGEAHVAQLVDLGDPPTWSCTVWAPGYTFENAGVFAPWSKGKGDFHLESSVPSVLVIVPSDFPPTSSNQDCVGVGAALTAIGEGHAEILLMDSLDAVVDRFPLTVTKPSNVEIHVDQFSEAVGIMDAAKSPCGTVGTEFHMVLNASAAMDEKGCATLKGVSWSWSDEAILQRSDRSETEAELTLRAAAEGESVVTASFDGLEATVAFRVVKDLADCQ